MIRNQIVRENLSEYYTKVFVYSDVLNVVYKDLDDSTDCEDLEKARKPL